MIKTIRNIFRRSLINSVKSLSKDSEQLTLEKIEKEKNSNIYKIKRRTFFLTLVPSVLIIYSLAAAGYSSLFSYLFAMVFYILVRAILAYRNLITKEKTGDKS